MGTEVISKADGSIAGLLGASPGASVAPDVMIKLALRCFPAKAAEWEEKIKALVPEYGKKLNDDAALAKRVQNDNAEVLGIALIP